MSTKKYERYLQLLSAECSLEACNIILDDYNIDCGTVGLVTLSAATDVSTSNELVKEAVVSMLQAIKKNAINGAKATYSYLINSGKHLRLKTKSCEALVGTLNAKAHGLSGSSPKFLTNKDITLFSSKPIASFNHMQLVVNNITELATNAHKVHSKLTKLATSMNEYTKDTIGEEIKDILDMVAGNKHADVGYNDGAGMMVPYGNKLLAINYDTINIHYKPVKHKFNDTVQIPPLSKISEIVTQANVSLKQVLTAAKVVVKYNAWSTTVRKRAVELTDKPTSAMLFKLSHIYTVMCYKVVYDAISATEKYATIATLCIDEYKE